MATATVINKNKRFAEVVDNCQTYISKVIDNTPIKSLVIYDVPFRVRIQNITVPGYSPSNVPPIGVAIIGFNNYIL